MCIRDRDINIECIEPKVIINDDKISYKDGEDGSKLDEEALYLSLIHI